MHEYKIVNRLNRYFVMKEILELDHKDLMFKMQGTGYDSATMARNSLFAYLDKHDIRSNFKIVS